MAPSRSGRPFPQRVKGINPGMTQGGNNFPPNQQQQQKKFNFFFSYHRYSKPQKGVVLGLGKFVFEVIRVTKKKNDLEFLLVFVWREIIPPLSHARVDPLDSLGKRTP